jgi:mono/diheme cytochrome c family protein
MPTITRSRSFWMTVSAVVALAGFGLTAQTPVTNPTTQAPVVQGAGQAQAPPDAAGGQAGRGGGRGRGGPENLAGGPQLDDPAYANMDFSKKAPELPRTPEEQLTRFVLQPGYRLELVLADPIIQEPAAIAFDGNGRMFVLEIRGYMQDADAGGELDPIGRISLHTDTNNDGVYDKHSVFVDKLVFPRFVTPFGPNTILAKESHAQEVWKYTDTNNDGVADKRELFDTGYGRFGNVEHEESHLTWGLDNWMYSTYNAFRARWTPNGIVKETTGAGGAQWGVSQDNDGKMWFQGGASGMPGYFQFPILYGNYSPQDAVDPELRTTWGAPVRVADMQGGLSATRMPDGSLRSTTAGAGGEVFRGDRLPKDLIGEYVYGEVVARIVRRVRPEVRDGLTYLKNAYLWDEFIKSKDPYFRPVDQTTAPDGTLYITDMYHGIIQQATWSGRGTYLRARIEQYDLDKVIHKGRIWRLVYDGVKRDNSDALDRDTTMPRMNDETPAQLVRHLGHPNGWWRDTAQQLLVLKQDKSVVPALLNTLKLSTNLLEKFHVLWTLEGLGALDAATVRQQMEDREPRMRIQAIRASETLYKAGDRSFAADYRRFARDTNPDVAIQAVLTLNRWKVPEASTAIKSALDGSKSKGVTFVANAILNPSTNAGRGGGGGGRGGAPARTPEQQKAFDRGGEIYRELCFTCHGDDGLGTPRATGSGTMGPSLAGSPRVTGHRDYVVKTLLHGLNGPVDGKSYTELMIPMGTNPDEWIAAVSSYIRNSFGNTGGYVTPDDVKRVRGATGTRKTPWTVPELTTSLPVRLLPDDTWKTTASHNAAAAKNAYSLTAWNTQTPQAAGMWFQIELPQPATVAEIAFESTAGGRGGGGGGRGGGRGGRGAAAAPGAAGTPPPDPAAAAEAPPPPPPNAGYPRGYKVEVSQNGTAWTEVATGAGSGPSTVIMLTPTPAKFIRLTQTATTENAPVWSIQQLRIFEVAKPAGR